MWTFYWTPKLKMLCTRNCFGRCLVLALKRALRKQNAEDHPSWRWTRRTKNVNSFARFNHGISTPLLVQFVLALWEHALNRAFTFFSFSCTLRSFCWAHLPRDVLLQRTRVFRWSQRFLSSSLRPQSFHRLFAPAKRRKLNKDRKRKFSFVVKRFHHRNSILFLRHCSP